MYFVYYCDGCYDDGDVGFSVFDSLDLALQFIEDRLVGNHDRSPIQYILVEGKALPLEVVEYVKKVRVANGQT